MRQPAKGGNREANGFSREASMRARADKKPSMDFPSESKSDVGDAAGHVPGGRSQVQMSACSMLRVCVHLHPERSAPLKAPKCPCQSRRSSTTTLHCCGGLMACFLPACCVPCKTADTLVSRAARTARKGLPWALNRIPRPRCEM